MTIGNQMKDNTQPIFQDVFGELWPKLPQVMHKHYANKPYSDDVVTAEGTLDISFNLFGKLCTPFFRIFGTLIPYQGKNIKTTVHYKSSPHDNSVAFDRVLYFANRKPFYFKSKMVPIRNHHIIEYMKFGLGWSMHYDYENGMVKLKHRGYVLKIFGKNIPLPLGILIGKGYAQEEAISPDCFKMFVTITHPLWGKIYEYRGQFTIINT